MNGKYIRMIVRILSSLLIVIGLAASSQSAKAVSPSVEGTENGPGVATIGTVVAVHGPILILKQESLQFSPEPNVKVGSVEHHLSIGHPGNHLEVVTDEDTQVFVGDERTPLSALSPGIEVVVAGRAAGSSLKAIVVSDLSSVGPPPEDIRPLVGDSLDPTASDATSSRFSTWLATVRVGDSPDPTASDAIEVWAVPSQVGAKTLSLCMGQDMDYDADPNVREFQGCWGGPSAADNINIPDIPLGCGLLGCFMLDRYSYTAALGGWGFDFPFRFSAASSGLIYHVPGSVSLNVQSLEATEGAFTFWGGLGIDFGINVDLCNLFGCFDLGWFHINQFSTIHQATGAAPMPGQTLDISEVGCPSIGVIGIPDLIDLLSVGLCEDLGLDGVPFEADVKAEGSAPLVWGHVGFDGADKTLSLRPDALSVDLIFDKFWYVPDITMGMFFRLCGIECIFTIWDSPTIHIVSGPFPAITTPFPAPGSVMTVATDPLSPIDDLQYLYQPTDVTLNLPVDPAPTRLTIISSNTLAEGEPVQALLQEDYDGTPISGETVIFNAGSVTVSAITDASGVAQVTLPIGEYTLLASFGGSAYYLPSSDSQGPLYVYRPTNFVIWGGNAEGVQVDQRYQFWGSQWWKQVTGGDFKADASFKGYAEQRSDTTWSSPPANAVRPPKTLPSYIGVIVTTQMGMHGRHVTGNIANLVVLKVEDPSAFRPNLGNPAWGVMKAEIVAP